MLSKFGEIFVNDAFSCSHRAHASVDKIAKILAILLWFANEY